MGRDGAQGSDVEEATIHIIVVADVLKLELERRWTAGTISN
jgi:hypothetical protein